MSDEAGEARESSSHSTTKLVDHLFRRKSGEMVASLTRVFGPRHLDLVEDVVQEALVSALRRWPFHGVPDRPEAWLVRVARNRALDRLRRDRALPDKEQELAEWVERSSDEERELDELRDDTLRMIFSCCVPDLSREARVALTLRTLCGLGTGEIARAFLAREEAIAQRIVRAKKRLREVGSELVFPGPSELPERLPSVLEVLYSMFNEGYATHGGDDLVRRDLIDESARLIELLANRPETATPELFALRALISFHAARLATRTDTAGQLLLLDQQDRSKWDAGLIARGLRDLRRASSGTVLTRYHVEAAIASFHATSPSFEQTNWAEILRQYDLLRDLAPSPVVELNRAVAIAMTGEIDRALRELDELASSRRLSQYFLFPAVRGELLRRSGRLDEARVELERAQGLTCSQPEHDLVQKRLDEC